MPMSLPTWAGVGALVLTLVLSPLSCSEPPPPADGSTNRTLPPPAAEPSPSARPSLVRLDEHYESTTTPGDHVDALVFWSDGKERFWVIAAAKEGNHLNVYDATSGELLEQVGQSGRGALEFQRPHDMAVVDDLLLVAERDNGRVQILELPSLEWVGFLGVEELEVPYGIGILPTTDGRGGYDVYVGDNYAATGGDLTALARRIKRFRVGDLHDSTSTVFVGAFGDTTREGALFRVEVLTGDPEDEILLVAESASGEVKVYSREGSFLRTWRGGRSQKFEPEALALVRCPGKTYLMTSEDEFSMSIFRIFDPGSLELLGAFVGAATTNSDGLVADLRPLPNFPGGAVFASNDDRSVVAFSWLEIERATSLPSSCGASPAAGAPAG